MPFTVLSFPFASLLTSSKMSQMFDNFTMAFLSDAIASGSAQIDFEALTVSYL